MTVSPANHRNSYQVADTDPGNVINIPFTVNTPPNNELTGGVNFTANHRGENATRLNYNGPAIQNGPDPDQEIRSSVDSSDPLIVK